MTEETQVLPWKRIVFTSQSISLYLSDYFEAKTAGKQEMQGEFSAPFPLKSKDVNFPLWM